MNFYEFDQMNINGKFICNDKICHRLYIQANNEHEAINKAQELGIDFNEFNKNGYRWEVPSEINLVSRYEIEDAEYEVEVFDWQAKKNKDLIKIWNKLYGFYNVLQKPILTIKFGKMCAVGKIKLLNIENYAQFFANKYGKTTPDCRIYYANGVIKEIFSQLLLKI